jgi:hypothetical protein
MLSHCFFFTKQASRNYTRLRLKSVFGFINIFSPITPEYLRPSFKEKYAELHYRKGKNNDRFIEHMREYKKVKKELEHHRYKQYAMAEEIYRQAKLPQKKRMCETERMECEETIKNIQQTRKALNNKRNKIAYTAFIYFVKTISAQRSFNELYKKIPYSKQRACYGWLKDTVKKSEKLLSKRNWQNSEEYSNKMGDMNRYMQEIWRYRYYDPTLRFPSKFKVGGKKDDSFQFETRWNYYRDQYNNLLKI